MVNPTDKSIPPEMMTKVWPRPSKSGVTVKIAMDLTLNGLNKKRVVISEMRPDLEGD